ncbi:cyclase family protein [Aliikangiella sp. G2MR2-5]|uniref:cyclase family protein n=1 Tax=Aliikangiella sp. G2MR2-5 TaxID=2788943 RepID=UPI0018A9D58C|nr:cyclase family protein [Aliikangiella sp. G2MR2-5]
MKISLTIDNKDYSADLSEARSIAISLLPDGEQPSHFGAPACTSETLEGGGFVGDTKRGGSCNVNQLTIIPHCNGTHTESISHIVNEMIPVHQAISSNLFPCVLISVTPSKASEVTDHYTPGFDPDNLVISRRALESALDSFDDSQLEGLVIRTKPNGIEKKVACYDESNYPVYLTADAMRYIVERSVSHLLVDFPSVDKMFDEGMLSNHRIFWRVPPGKTSINESSFLSKTITEMIYAHSYIADGLYLCNLQIPEIVTDAVPSRPELIPLVAL